MSLQDLSLWAQIIAAGFQPCTLFLVFITFLIYFLQLQTMQAQLRAAREGVASQNLLSLVAFLQEEPTRQARRRVIKQLSTLTREQWSEEDRNAADKVCSTYDIAAILLRNGFVDYRTIADNWGPSIKQCFEILRPYIREIQMPDEAGPAYWNDFEWLYQKALSFQARQNATGT